MTAGMLAVLILGLSNTAATASSKQTPAGAERSSSRFGELAYQDPAPSLAAGIARDFDVAEASKSLNAIARAYKLKLTAADRAFLAAQRFLIKDIPGTSLRPVFQDMQSEHGREMLGLYNGITGDRDARGRGPQNAIFYSADVFTNIYSIVLVELLKELEGTTFLPGLRGLTESLFRDAAQRAGDPAGPETAMWRRVRNYLAVPYALLANTADGRDTLVAATKFVRGLHLEAEDEKTVVADLGSVFAQKDGGIPAVFAAEYGAFSEKTRIDFTVAWSLFTPRGNYTSTAARRQYFRAVSWFGQVPFFSGSSALTRYAFALTQLLADNPSQLAKYREIHGALEFLVGTPDDPTPIDYLPILTQTRGAAQPEEAREAAIANLQGPSIKALAAGYAVRGTVQTADVLAASKGMRFLGGRFLLDSYWMGRLTQGDEAPRPGYPAKLPPFVSSLEVMALLGSDDARARIHDLDYAQGDSGRAIDAAMTDLDAEIASLGPAFWQRDAGTLSLWALRGLFAWPKAHKEELPAFMRSPRWGLKTLMTGSGFWTELRHATVLYAKQSNAEMGAGSECDPRKVPAPAKGYIEPDVLLFARLLHLARRVDSGLLERGYKLKTLAALQSYEALLETVNAYVADELADKRFEEKVTRHEDEDPDQPSGTCVWYELDQDSRWEKIRLLSDSIARALPEPVEGSILPAKDKRTALVADVHTAGARVNEVLYEGIGVPKVILVAVKDSNGPRVTIGFVYSHYEFREKSDEGRLTDEKWQARFYEPVPEGAEESADPFKYTDPQTWPAAPAWYDPILKIQ